MTLHPGDVLETAIWCDGTETAELKDRFENDLRTSLAAMADTEGIIIGPLVMTEKKPGGDRMPPRCLTIYTAPTCGCWSERPRCSTTRRYS